MASLFAGESYVGLPAAPNGEVVTWQAHLQSAITDFSRRARCPRMRRRGTATCSAGGATTGSATGEGR